ncbi:hypothetical protein EVAR_103297_1 [Eumeta japonica]|uniref:Uncharacterized protein n=1 Tax=Eumeta variegata TaxID=151549 RepID=A0A4C1XT76_EUMVA|nr:hypothetical protein EVAR_103297_1 [Eumeta japonica]
MGTVKGSDVEEGPFQTVIAKRKNRKVARRQRKISNNSSNSDMEIETRQLKPTTKTDSPASPDPHNPATVTATESDDVDYIKEDLDRQGYPILRAQDAPEGWISVRNGSGNFGKKDERAKEIFNELGNVCGLSGIQVEAPYRKRVPGQCHRCQMYGHAAANAMHNRAASSVWSRIGPKTASALRNQETSLVCRREGTVQPARVENSWNKPLPWVEPRHDDIDNAIGALTSHITTVVENSSRKVPAKSDRKELPRDVIELIRDKNAALRRAGKYQPVKIGPVRVLCNVGPTDWTLSYFTGHLVRRRKILQSPMRAAITFASYFKTETVFTSAALAATASSRTSAAAKGEALRNKCGSWRGGREGCPRGRRAAETNLTSGGVVTALTADIFPSLISGSGRRHFDSCVELAAPAPTRGA